VLSVPPIRGVPAIGLARSWQQAFERVENVFFSTFKYFVLPKALKPYKKLQKCRSENTVGR
jgi:hypothetical protein